MALNLSPRPYHIDPTGRDYILDPAPLLRAQEKNFQLQNETQRMVAETGRKGMEFAEYLGARQQLGRVKAQLSELDPNDPEFHRRLSSIIADNPLALENPNTAPGLKMALAPLTEEAGRAAKHRYEMEELTATYSGRDRLQAARAQGQMDVWQYKQNNAPQTEAEKLGLTGPAVPLPGASDITDSPASAANAFSVTPGDKLLVPVPASAAPSVAGSAPGVDGPDASLLPFGPSDGEGPSPLPDLTSDPLPPGVKRGNDGALYERKSVGKSSTWTPYKVAPEKPTTPLPEGKEWVPELHDGTNDVKGWKAMAAPKLPKESQAAIAAQAKLIGKSDPEYIAIDTALSEAEGAFKKAKIIYDGYSKTTPEGIKDREDMQPHMAQLAETQVRLEKQKEQKIQEISLQALTLLYPQFAANKRKFEAAANGTDSILETPPPIAAPPITAIPARPVPAPPSTTAGKLDAALKAFK